MRDGDVSLVVGGTGFIGTHLVAALVARGAAVRVMARGQSRLPPARPSVELVVGDVANRGQLAHAIEGVSTVYHLASSTVPASSAADPGFDIETNVVAAMPLLEACAARQIRLVFASSGGTVYGVPTTVPIPETHDTWPISTHGVGKLAVEKLLFAFGYTRGLDYRIARLSNVFGEGQNPHLGMGAISTFLAKILAGHAIELWGDGSQCRDFVYVADAVAAMLALGTVDSPDWRVFNIGSGAATRISELCSLIFRITGRHTPIHKLPARPFDVAANVLDIQRARQSLGFAPTLTLDEGIRKTWAWLAAHSTSGLGLDGRSEC